MDWCVHEGSRIERLPKIVRPAALLARNLKSSFRRADDKTDGIATIHGNGFESDPAFKKAYARAVRAGGWDYRIPYRVHQALWCAKLALRVPGCFVELGTGRGFIFSAILESGIERDVHLFDTFSPAKDSGLAPYYAASAAPVVDNFRQWPNVWLHASDVKDSIPKADFDSVAFLHVDLNNAEAEELGVRALWPKMPSGAVMLLDDYCHAGFEDIHETHNRLAVELGFSILSTPTGQGIVVK